MHVIGGHGKHPAMRGGKAAIAKPRVGGADDRDAARQSRIEQACEQSVGGAAQAQIDHLHVLVDSKLQSLGEREAVANSAGPADRRLPTGAKRVEPCVGRNARDTDAVIGTRRDDPGNRRSMQFGNVALTIDEIAC